MTPAPASLDELVDVVARTSPTPLRIAGAGTKRPPAGPRDDDSLVLDMRRLSGIVTYDPAECVVTAWTGTPVADVAAALAAHGQYLPWDPPLSAEGATLGGMVASGLNGSGRYRYGGVRDFVIGAQLVDGRGRLIASGGHVVKNAAGFLTHHALVGSAGRLGVIAQTSFKVFPKAEAGITLVARADSIGEAIAAHERLRLANLDLEALDLDAETRAVQVRLAGAADALDARAARAAGVLALPVEHVSGERATRMWGNTASFAWAPAGAVVIKLPTSPSRVAATLAAVQPLGACRVACGGAVTYVATHDAAQVSAVLAHHQWRGAVVRGGSCGERVGASDEPLFGERVRATLDPDRRFR